MISKLVSRNSEIDLQDAKRFAVKSGFYTKLNDEAKQKLHNVQLQNTFSGKLSNFGKEMDYLDEIDEDGNVVHERYGII